MIEQFSVYIATATVAAGGFWVRKNGTWRAICQAWIRKNGEWRKIVGPDVDPSLTVQFRKNGAWRQSVAPPECSI